eukprot:CAMPEP_0168545640 /NCGR_PEP_ID=MMETSP0413-20121227/3067_1 /TAXON_ID=136452 /ORGANISM="Filamoeba nolandi, Strain NC-AS-23-1" /LENGTH=899 /DNA_ID=CAMNT_0008575753 /DNA_START=158 /DNA_END=2857 /DNA_ORIENTATION=-
MSCNPGLNFSAQNLECRPLPNSSSFTQESLTQQLPSSPSTNASSSTAQQQNESPKRSLFFNESSEEVSPSKKLKPSSDAAKSPSSEKKQANSTPSPRPKRTSTRLSTSPSFPSSAQVKQEPENPSSATWKPNPELPSAPVFYPTEEEFRDPMKYLSSIREVAKEYGICKIVPPSDKWLQGKPCLTNIDPSTFIFQTKVQNIHQLMKRTGAIDAFLNQLGDFYNSKGIQIPLTHLPVLGGKEIDLRKFYSAVMKRGGYDQVVAQKKWRDVARELHIPEDCTSAGYSLRMHYETYLLEFEKNERQQAKKKFSNEKKPTVTSPKSENSKSSKNEDKSDANEFGYYDGKMFTMATFKKMADAFKKRWFPNTDIDKIDPKVIENLYWKIVETAEENVQVHYGSDLDVGCHGSGFPNTKEWLEQASGWNLNKFAKFPGSLLNFLPESISGVTIPMMYVGMLFSTFCWHVEDNYLYSINYIHHGAPKVWYGIPEHAATKFEEVMKNAVPELFQAHPDLLFMLVTMLPPRLLVENNVPVYTCVQNAGEFMITCPKAYHAGFNQGFNFAESTNFALDDWLPLGRDSIDLYRPFGRASVLSLERLLFKAVYSTTHSDPEAPRLKGYKQLHSRLRHEVGIMRQTERSLRRAILKAGIWKSARFKSFYADANPSTNPLEDCDIVDECSICKYDCYLSAVVCPCKPQKIACLRHWQKLCSCDHKRKVLLYRYKIADIDNLLVRLGPGKEDELTQEYNNINTDDAEDDVYFTPYRITAAGRSRGGKKLQSSHSPTKPTNNPPLRKLARSSGTLNIVDGGEVDLDEATTFTMEKLEAYRTHNNVGEYLIKWEGLGQSECIWEPAVEMPCQGLVNKFWGTTGKAESHKPQGLVPITPPKRSARTTKGKRPSRSFI